MNLNVRAKFQCQSVELLQMEPTPVKKYVDGVLIDSDETTWPRVYKFAPQYDQSVPEDQRYAKASPTGQLTLRVDNPAVAWRPGEYYYLDFVPVDAA